MPRLPSYLRHVALAVTLCLVAMPLDAFGQDAPRRTDVRLTMLGTPWLDAAYLALGTAALLVGSLALNPPNVDVAPLDGLGHRDAQSAAATASDIVLGAGIAVSLGLGAVIERFGSGSRGWEILRAPLVLGESVVMTLGVVELVKNIVGECRPRSWDDETQRCVGAVPGSPTRSDRTSFPSGHAAPMAALLGASIGLWLFPSRGRSEYLPLVLVTGALAIANLVLRVVAGAHTWIDTSAGFVLGLGTGLGTAALHTSSAGSHGGTVSVSRLGITYSGRL